MKNEIWNTNIVVETYIFLNPSVTPGGALLAKYSYKKLSQNEAAAEFISEECSPEYKAPIIKTGHSRSRSQSEHTDDDIEETVRLLETRESHETRDSDTCTESESIMQQSCSMSCSTDTGTQYCSDTGTQYCSRDTDTDTMTDFSSVSIQYPLTLQEDDCDWGKCHTTINSV